MRIKISTKIISGFVPVILLMVVLALYLIDISQKSLYKSVGMSSIFLAEETLKRMNHEIYLKIENLQSYSQEYFLQKALLKSNHEFETLKNIQRYIDKNNKHWTSVPKEKITPFMQELISNELSNSLKRKYIEFYDKKYGYRIFGKIIVTNKYGVNIAQTGKTSDYKQDDKEWWQIAKEKGFYISTIKYDESAAIHNISIGVRIDSENKNFAGVMKAVIDVKGIVRETEIAIKKYETTEIRLLTKDGRIIYATKPFHILEDVSNNEFFKNIEGNRGFFISRESGRERLYSFAHSKGYRNFEGLQWILLIGHDIEEVLKPIIILRDKMVAASLILIIATILIVFFISRFISRPIVKLTRSAEIIGKGDLKHRVEIDTKDEIGELAASFNTMTQALSDREEELKESEAKYRAIFTGARDGMVLIDSETCRIFDCNREFECQTGKNLEQLRKMKIWEVSSPEKVESAKKEFLEAREKDSGGPGELEFQKPGGEIIPIERLSKGIKIQGRKYIQSITRDITERKHTEEVLARSKAKFEAMFNSIPDAVMFADTERRIVLNNPAVHEMFGYSDDELIGNTTEMLYVDKEDYLEQGRRRYHARSNTPTAPYEVRYRRKDGSVFWTETIGTQVKDENDNNIGFIGLFRDITERKMAEEELAKHRDHLEELVEKRTIELHAAHDELLRKERLATLGQLAATVSHELRNPLGTLKASLYTVTDMLKGKGLGIDRALARMDRNINRCVNIIEEMLDFSRVHELRLQSVAIDEWLAELLKEQAVSEGVTLGQDLCAALDIMIDGERLRRAIINVIDNACQALTELPDHKERLVTVRTQVKDGRRLLITIVDTGPGIPEEDQTHVFEPLYSTKGFGVGLGLPIVKQILEQHGGGVEISSEEGHGTQVLLWLPLSEDRRQRTVKNRQD